MRKMYSKKQVEELVKNNSTKLYKHTLTFNKGESSAEMLLTDVVVSFVDNKATNYSFNIDSTIAQYLEDDEEYTFVSSWKLLNPAIEYSIEDDTCISTVKAMFITDQGSLSVGDRNAAIVVAQYQDTADLIGFSVIDTVEQL